MSPLSTSLKDPEPELFGATPSSSSRHRMGSPSSSVFSIQGAAFSYVKQSGHVPLLDIMHILNLVVRLLVLSSEIQDRILI
jgi:hypothetical protein